MQIVTGPEVVTWVHVKINRVCPDPNLAQGLGFVIGDKRAGAAYHNVNEVNCEIAVAAESGFQWTRAALEALFSYPFRQLELQRVTAMVASDNFESQRFAERLGCTLEARMERACKSGDLLVYRMFRSECKWLRGRSDVRTLFEAEAAANS